MSLGTGAKKGWVGAPRKYETEKGGFHGDSVSRNQPCQRLPTSTFTLKELQWKYSPNTACLVLSRKGRVVNLLVKECRTNRYDSKARADGE